LPAPQTVIEHEHARIDGASRKPPSFDAIGADNHRRRARQ
jgi:hypothetical protein